MSDELDFETLLADIRRQQGRAEEASYLEFKKEAANNLYPLLEAIVESFNARFDDLEEAVYVGQNSLQPEITYRIAAVLAIGERIAQMAEALFAVYGGTLDEVTTSRLAALTEGKGTLTTWTEAYRADAQQVINELREITIEPDEEEGDDDGDEGDEGEETDAPDEEEGE